MLQVHEDARGTIYSIFIPPNQELMLFYCKAGYCRGGHSHSVPEIVTVLSGRLIYHKMIDGQEIIAEKQAGDVILNLPTEPHMAEFLEDSWVSEWKLGTHIGGWFDTTYQPFRSRVNRSIA